MPIVFIPVAAILKMAAILAIIMNFGFNLNITSHDMLKYIIRPTFIEFTETTNVFPFFWDFEAILK